MRSIIHYTNPRSFSLLPSSGFASPSPWAGLEDEIDRLFGATLSGFMTPALENRFPVDLYEDKDHTYVRADLPGVNRDEINVEMVNGYLTINATRKTKGRRRRGVLLVQPLGRYPGGSADRQGQRRLRKRRPHRDAAKREETKAKKIAIEVK